MRWLALVVVVIGVVAMRRSDSTPAVAAKPPPAARVVWPRSPPPPPQLHVEPDTPELVVEEELEAEVDVSHILAQIAELEASLRTTGAVQGLVRDSNGEPMIGATVVATRGASDETLVAITDENGAYSIAYLVPGMYTVTIYYIDHATEFEHVGITAGSITPLYARIYADPIRVHDGEGTDDLGVSFTGTTSVDNVYIIE